MGVVPPPLVRSPHRSSRSVYWKSTLIGHESMLRSSRQPTLFLADLRYSALAWKQRVIVWSHGNCSHKPHSAAECRSYNATTELSINAWHYLSNASNSIWTVAAICLTKKYFFYEVGQRQKSPPHKIAQYMHHTAIFLLEKTPVQLTHRPMVLGNSTSKCT